MASLAAVGTYGIVPGGALIVKMFAMDKTGIAQYGFKKFCDDVHVV